MIDHYPGIPASLKLTASPERAGIGQRVSITASVKVHEDIGWANLAFDLPDNLYQVSGASSREDLMAPGSEATFNIAAIATGNGPAPVTVHLTSERGFTRSSSMNIWVGPMPATDKGPTMRSGPKGIVTVEGNWTYEYEYMSNKFKPISGAKVELWDNDTGQDDLLATSYTDDNGHFKFSVNNADADEGGALDVYTVVRTVSNCTEVRYIYPGNLTYYNRSAITVNVADGTLDQGNLRIQYYWAGPYNILVTINDGFDFVNSTAAWEAPMVPLYFPYELWPHSHGYAIHLPYDSYYVWEWQTRVILHEYGHTLMYNARGQKGIPGAGGPHSITSESNPGLAFSEGWANSYMCMVYNDVDTCWQDWSYKTGDIENSTAAEYVDYGDWDGNIVEGAVAAALWDIHDGWDVNDFFTWAVSPYGDGVDHEFSKLWNMILKDAPNHIDDVFSNWTSEYGHSTDIWAVFYHYRMNYDREVPNNPAYYISDPPTGKWTNDKTIDVNLSLATDDVSGVWGFNYTWSQTPKDPSSGPWYWGLTPTSPALTDGDWYLCVRTRDWAGNYSATYYCNPDPWKVDTDPPKNPTTAIQTKGTTVSGAWQNSVADPAFTWSGATDKLSGIWGYSIYFGNNSKGTSDANSTNASFDPPAVGTGIHFLRVQAIDVAGNKATAWFTLYVFQFDNTPPKAVTTCAQTQGVTVSDIWQGAVADPAFTWSTVIDPHSGLQGYRYYWGPDPQGTSVNLTKLSAIDPVPSGEGTYYLRISPIDNVGNAANWTTVYIFRFDGTAPTNPNKTEQTQGVTQSGVWQNLVSSPSFTWSGQSDPASGIDRFDVYWGTDPAGTSTINTTNATFSPGPLKDGAYYLRVQTVDKVGNKASWVTLYTFKIDATPPTAPVLVGKDGYFTTSQVNITVYAPVDVSGIKLYSYRVDDGNEETMAVASILDLQLLDGTHTLKLLAVDNAGNSGAYATLTIKVDKLPPQLSFDINSGAAYSTSVSVNLTINGSDATSGLSQMRFSTDGKTWSAWDTCSKQYVYTLTATDGPKTVFVQLKDAAGLASAAVQRSIILDTIKPVGAISIAGGRSSTSSANVDLTLTATDQNGPVEMRFSSDGITWGPWLPFQSSYKHSLGSGDGKRTVYVQYKDKAGQVSEPASDSITVQSGMGSSMLMMTLLAVVIVVVVIVIIIMLMRRKKAMPSGQTPPATVELAPPSATENPEIQKEDSNSN